MTDKIVIKLTEHKDMFDYYAHWQSEKWGIPVDAYTESLNESLNASDGVPNWFAVLDGNGSIIAGVGIIENDFHKRPDLRPNICALYVDKRFRRQGIARMLLDTACAVLAAHKVECAYLLTDHTDFYEHCGFTFYGTVEENGGGTARVYVRELV